GNLHFSIAADPNDPNVVFVGGDRQPGGATALKAGTGDGVVFPNATGALNFSARIFRGDASKATATAGPGTGMQWSWVTGKTGVNDPMHPTASISGAAGTAPHGDSRVLMFFNGTLLECDDGGISRLVNPNGVVGREWKSVHGNMANSE